MQIRMHRTVVTGGRLLFEIRQCAAAFRSCIHHIEHIDSANCWHRVGANQTHLSRSVTKETIALSCSTAQYGHGFQAAGRLHTPPTTLIARHTMHSTKSYFTALLVIVIASALIAETAVLITGVAV
jgi:hypothetical protein